MSKQKKKGIIRFEAIIPITIVFALFFAYFKFFFDSHLKKAMELGGTYANGAEVNIDSLSTSFLNASLDIRNIQVTNKELPSHNVIQIGSIQFKALWDALFRGKVVVPLASVTDIMVNTVRKKPGRVLPVKKSSENNMESMKSSALEVTNKVLEGSIFGDLADLAQGENYKEKLKEMEGNLKTSQFIQKMEKELKEKEKLWKERIEKLPQKEEIKALEARIKALKVDGKDPKAIINAVKDAEDLYKEIDSKYKTIKNTSGELSGDLKIYKNLYSDIKKYVDEDLKDLEAKMGLPSLDPKDMAMRVFGRQFAKEIYRAEKYMRLAREYMPPPKKDRQKPTITPRERQTGKDFKFRITRGYPKLWIQKAHVNSKATAEGFSGSIGGEILNISDDPKSIAQPMEAKLTGEFPKSQMYDVMIHAVVDHRTENAKEYGTIKVGAFPLKDIKLSESSDVTYGFQEATGSS
ncbi:TIGR03545 family protein, partial [bacterium]|nr:TIGR03545 family protein [bacterium]